MGYFVSILRERIANFEAPPAPTPDARSVSPPTPAIVIGVSINDLRKNLRDLNEHMDRECRSSAARYGITLDASLITGIDPPPEVESALAAINTAHNHVSSDISLAQASADQKIVQSQARGRDRDAEGAGRSRAAATRWRTSWRAEEERAPTRWRPTCATSGWPLQPAQQRVFWRFKR